MEISSELIVAVCLGLWFIAMGIAATIRVFRDYNRKGKN